MYEDGTLVALLRARASAQPDATAFVFLGEDGSAHPLTYGELDRHARALAVLLRRHAEPGERALLLHQPGLDYVTAFFACQYAGLVAVPAYPPNARQVGRAMPRLRAVVADSEPALALCDSPLVSVAERDGLFAPVRWLATDLPDADLASEWREPPRRNGDPAFLQYTSGSTASPRGVVLTHANVLHNLDLIRRKFGQPDDSVGCSWLPPYHDMGLIGGVLEPVHGGFPMVLMPPEHFVRDPALWLRTISRYGVTTTGAPDFAYQLCVERVTPEQIADVALGTWTLAFTGAEPVRASTMDAFAKAFARNGFRPEAWYPCYGLAEATLMVTGGSREAAPVVRRFDVDALAMGQAVAANDGRELVGCGAVGAGQQVEVVEAATRTPVEPGTVGEIWVRGPSVATGYWRGTADEGTFDGRLAADPDTTYLRTGDLGFLHDGELFVAGRIKDVLIVRGRNHYPQDIELTVAHSHERLMPVGAAFTVEVAGGSHVVCVHEVHRHTPAADLAAIADAARAAVSTAHGLSPHDIVLVKQASLPRTSSGKVQRGVCRDAYRAGDLAVRWRAIDETTVSGPGSDDPVRAAVARAMALPAERVNLDTPLTVQGVDSITAVRVAHALETDLGLALSAADLLGEEPLAVLVAEAGRAQPVAVHDDVDAPDPLSATQRRFWFLHQLDPADPAYHIPAAVRLRGPLRIPRLTQAVAAVVRRHEVLRTALRDNGNGVPVQVVLPEVDVPLEEIDRPTSVRDSLAELAVRPFDLATPPLLRAALLTLGHDDHVLAVVVHHAVADGWSMELLLRDLAAEYTGHAEEPSRFRFADFARWEAERTTAPDYWTRELADLPSLVLPTDRPRRALALRAAAEHRFTVSEDVVTALEELARGEGATLFMALLAAWQAVLHRYCGQEDFGVGVPVAGRDRPEFDNVIGCFVNTLVLRARPRGSLSYVELLRQVMHTARRGFQHQDVPFGAVVDSLRASRPVDRGPLVDVLFSFRAEVAMAGLLPGVDMAPVEFSTGAAKFDLSLELVRAARGVRGRVEYDSALFDAGTAARMASHFHALIADVVERPELELSRLSLAAVRGVGPVGEPTPARNPTGRVHERFAAHAVRDARALAVVAEDATMTYGELAVAADRLADRLAAAGIGAGARVGLVLGRTTRYLVGLLGVLGAGAAYVPIDPAEPAPRISRMLSLAGVRTVVTTSDVDAVLAGLQVEVVHVEDDLLAPHRDPREPAADDLAYVVFTSGSTGAPKGVGVEHRQLDSYLAGIEAVLDPGVGDRHAVVSTLAADLCLTTLLVPLATGGCVDLVPTAQAIDPAALSARATEAPWDFLKITPSHLSALLAGPDAAAALPRRTLVFGGELLEWDLVARVRSFAPDLDILNTYGPAEATVHVLYGRLPRVAPEHPSASVPLTHRIGGSTVYVLDEHLACAPAGVPGELYIGGPQVAREYVGAPEETAARFRPDPFDPAGRLYRTGDRARVRTDGSVEILGRIDRQLKVRGYRVEPGEIEQVLREHPGVSAAAVVVHRRDELVAHVVCELSNPDDAALREHLRRRLPAHFVPSAFVRHDALPITANGKLDREALRRSPVHREPVAERAPLDGFERSIAAIWCDLLGVEHVGVDDNFFDVGGHSLLLVRLQSLLRQRLDRDVPVRDLISRTTVRSQAGYLRDGGPGAVSSDLAHRRAELRRSARANRGQPRRGQRW